MFLGQCFLISNSNELPSKLKHLTQSHLSLITFSTDDIAKMIQNLDHNKAHGHDQISIRMLKLCSTSICNHLEIIFNQYVPKLLKKGNVPVFKKGNKFSKTTVQSCYFLCVVKYLRNWYTRKCLIFLLKTIKFRWINLVLNLGIPV